MTPIDERLKALNIVLPDIIPPVVDGYAPAFAPFIRSGDQIHLSGRLGKERGKPPLRMWTMRSAWIKASSRRATWQLNCWPCLKPPSAILAAFEES